MKCLRSLPQYRTGDPPAPSIRPRRVCLLIGQLGLGGAEKQVALLARGLAERGVQTSVLVMFAGGPREAALRAAGVPVVHLRCPRMTAGRSALRAATGLGRVIGVLRFATTTTRTVLGAAAGFLRLVACLRRIRPEVLHAFLFHSCVAAAPAAWLAGVPVLVAGRRNLGERHRDRLLPRVLARAANRSTDLVIANAQAVAEAARRAERLPESKVVTIRNGIEDSAFEPVAAAPIALGTPMILCVANLIWYKGHRHLLDAVAILAGRGVPCTLVLVGDGPERPVLEEQERALGLDVLFLGPRTDVDALLARADVCVLPSLTEGMSNAVMEAMAAGKPVVATDVGGTGELLRGRGVLVPPGDPVTLADGLALVLGDAAFAAGIGAEAARWSRANLRAETMVERHLVHYRQLLEHRCAA